MTPNPWASSTYSRASYSRQIRAYARQVRHVAGHAVDAVHAKDLDPFAGNDRRTSFEVLRVVGPDPVQGCPAPRAIAAPS